MRLISAPATVLHAPFTTFGASVPEDGNCVSHVTFPGGSIYDSKGNMWTQIGAVPQVATSQLYPLGFGAASRSGAGPFTSSVNYFQLDPLGTGTDVLDFAGDFLGVAVFRPTAVPTGVLVSNGLYQVDGYYLQFSGLTLSLVQSQSGEADLQSVGGCDADAINVVCFGRVGANNIIKLNLNGLISGVGKTITPATTRPARIGVYGDGGSATSSTVYELYFTTTTPTDALCINIVNHVFQQQGTMGEALIVARAICGSYEI